MGQDQVSILDAVSRNKSYTKIKSQIIPMSSNNHTSATLNKEINCIKRGAYQK